MTPDFSSLDFSAHLCTVQELSWPPGRMSYLSAEQKQNIRFLYKTGRKIAHSEAHIEFLTKCLECDFIPKSFRLKNSIPGNKQVNQVRLDQLSKAAISDEWENHINKLEFAQTEFVNQKKGLEKVFSEDAASDEIKRVEKHIERVKKLRREEQEKKIASYRNKDVSEETDDDMEQPDDLYVGLKRIFQEDGKPRRKRRFKRRYLQPQPKKTRKRKSKSISVASSLPEGWNGVVKNISGVPVSKVEESCSLMGKNSAQWKKIPP